MFCVIYKVHNKSVWLWLWNLTNWWLKWSQMPVSQPGKQKCFYFSNVVIYTDNVLPRVAAQAVRCPIASRRSRVRIHWQPQVLWFVARIYTVEEELRGTSLWRVGSSGQSIGSTDFDAVALSAGCGRLQLGAAHGLLQ